MFDQKILLNKHIGKYIGLLPLGKIPKIVLKIIAANISAYLNLSAKILTPLNVPDFAFDKRRLQYDSGVILKELESMNFSDCEKVIGVINHDLFVPIFTHVYGEARQGGEVALVSLFRLSKNIDGSSPLPSIFYERAVKVALHELGHLYNLFHCNEKRCLMHFSGDIEDLDKTPVYLCRSCSALLPR